MFLTTCTACGMRASQPSPNEVGDSYDGLCFKCEAEVTWHRQQGSRYGAAGCHCDSCWVSHLEAAEMGAVYHRGSRVRYVRAVRAEAEWWAMRAEYCVDGAAVADAAEDAARQLRAAARYDRAARRARAILERLEAGR